MTGTSQGRLVGLDVARCLALLGMVATHVLDERTPGGDLTTAQWLAGGRASVRQCSWRLGGSPGQRSAGIARRVRAPDQG